MKKLKNEVSEKTSKRNRGGQLDGIEGIVLFRNVTSLLVLQQVMPPLTADVVRGLRTSKNYHTHV